MALLSSSSASAQERAPPYPQAMAKALGKLPADGGSDCRNDDPKAVVVCGRSPERFRIDPAVLAATRAAEAVPPKPALDATAPPPCTG